MADGIGHRQHGQPKGKRDADKPDAEVDIGVVGSQKMGGENRASAAGEDKPGRTEQFGKGAFGERDSRQGSGSFPRAAGARSCSPKPF